MLHVPKKMILFISLFHFLKRKNLSYYKKLGEEFIGFDCMASAQKVVYCSDFKEFAKELIE